MVIAVMLIMGITAFMGCEKAIDKTIASDITANTTNMQMRTNVPYYEKLSESAIDSIGILHNEFVIEIFSHIDLNNLNSESKEVIFKEAVMNSNLRGSEEAWKTNIFDFTLNNESFIVPEIVELYLDSINYLIYNEEEYASYVDKLNGVKQGINSIVIDEYDAQLVKISISIAIHSGYLWFPENKGGSGFGDDILSNNDAIECKNVLAADVAGGLGGGIQYSVVLVLGGPFGLGAYCGAILGSAAFGSAWAALAG